MAKYDWHPGEKSQLQIRKILHTYVSTRKVFSDTGQVAEDDLPLNSTTATGAIIAGATLNSFSCCLACKSKVEQTEDDTIAHCTKCNMDQLLDRCMNEVHANLVINSGSEYMQLTAFHHVLKQIVRGKEVTVQNLLTAPPFTCTYENKIITSVCIP